MDELEKIEKLRSKGSISYEEAREALKGAEGDLLEAIIDLERQGKITQPAHEGFYSTESAAVSQSGNVSRGGGAQNDQHSGPRVDASAEGKGKDVFSSICQGLGRILHLGNTNYLDVTKVSNMTENGEQVKKEKLIMTVPLTVFVLLLILGFWVILPIMLVCLFFGIRYSFRGKDLTVGEVNKVMDKAADTAENIKTDIKRGME